MSLYKIQSGQFGYRVFGFFQHLFTLREAGFEYKNQLIVWSQIRKIEIYSVGIVLSSIAGNDWPRTPAYMIIYFDGGMLRIAGTILEKEDKSVGLSNFSTTAYAFLQDILLKKINSNIIFYMPLHIKYTRAPKYVEILFVIVVTIFVISFLFTIGATKFFKP